MATCNCRSTLPHTTSVETSDYSQLQPFPFWFPSLPSFNFAIILVFVFILLYFLYSSAIFILLSWPFKSASFFSVFLSQTDEVFFLSFTSHRFLSNIYFVSITHRFLNNLSFFLLFLAPRLLINLSSLIYFVNFSFTLHYFFCFYYLNLTVIFTYFSLSFFITFFPRSLLIFMRHKANISL